MSSGPGNCCGRVDRYNANGSYGGVYWSGYGDDPNKMWSAVTKAHRDGATHLQVIDSGSCRVW